MNTGYLYNTLNKEQHHFQIQRSIISPWHILHDYGRFFFCAYRSHKQQHIRMSQFLHNVDLKILIPTDLFCLAQMISLNTCIAERSKYAYLLFALRQSHRIVITLEVNLNSNILIQIDWTS